MRSLFDHTKRVYTTTAPFLSAPELGFTEPAQLETIRKANMASFVSSIFGSQEVGFPALNENFLSIFVPEGGRLLKMQGALFLELKTQAFIAAMNSKDRSNSDLLYHLFPDDLGLKLLARRPGTRHLAPTETDFVKRAWSRRDILVAEADTLDARTKLIERYRWEDFLRDLSTYISKNFESIGGIEVRVHCRLVISSVETNICQFSSPRSLPKYALLQPRQKRPLNFSRLLLKHSSQLHRQIRLNLNWSAQGEKTLLQELHALHRLRFRGEGLEGNLLPLRPRSHSSLRINRSSSNSRSSRLSRINHISSSSSSISRNTSSTRSHLPPLLQRVHNRL